MNYFKNLSLSLQEIKQIFYWKTDLILNGVKIGQKFLNKLELKGIPFNEGRKGGAGPSGGRYFLFETNSIANIPILPQNSPNTHLTLNDLVKENPLKKGFFYVSIFNEFTNEKFDKIQLIPISEEYNLKQNLDGTINKQIALIHGINTLASTIYQKCSYWQQGKKCKFCGIEYSLKNKNTIEKKTAEQLIKAIDHAKKLNLCQHITLTSGSTSEPDKGALYYIDVVKKIKTKFPNLPIHVQIEPIEDFSLINKLKEAGVDTLGVHIEILDDKIRKIYCPGKFQTPKSFYYKFWKKSVEIFGKEQVTSFILVGFGENINQLTAELNQIIKIGVIPIIVPVRKITGTNIQNQINLNDLISIYNCVAKSMLKYNINPFNIKAGCGRCGGCSSILDAYLYWYLNTRKNKN
ncbi:MAG: radical SAM protein [Promethearchaeota archaeon]